MQELLGLAADDKLDEQWPRVHAINILRLALQDKTLATDASSFFAEGTMRARDLMHNPRTS